MKAKRISLVVFVLAMCVPASVLAQDEGWATYYANEHGFSMLMPVGTQFVETQYGGGWAQLNAEYQGVRFFAMTKLGEYATAAEIEDLGVKLTGIPARYWKQINDGEHEHGWTWFRTVEASNGGKLVVGDYGIGPKGSYLIVLETTESDYRAYRSDYVDWYNSIRLF